MKKPAHPAGFLLPHLRRHAKAGAKPAFQRAQRVSASCRSFIENSCSAAMPLSSARRHQACRSARQLLARVRRVRATAGAALRASVDHLVEHRVCSRVPATRCGRAAAGHLVVVAVQPALGAPSASAGRLALGLQLRQLVAAGTAHFACVAGHHLVAVGDHGLSVSTSATGLTPPSLQLRRDLLAPWPAEHLAACGCRPSRCRTRTA